MTWSATGEGDEGTETNSETVTFTKRDPNSVITVWVESATAPYIYVWYTDADGKTQEPNGAWASTKAMTATTSGWYSYVAPAGVDKFNFILQKSAGGEKLTADVTDVTSDVYYKVEGDGAAATSDRPGSTSNPARLPASLISTARTRYQYSSRPVGQRHRMCGYGTVVTTTTPTLLGRAMP